jgi:hypothetical protein
MAFRGDHVHQRPALDAGEDRRVQRASVLRAGEDHAAARAAQRLVRRRRDRIRDADWTRIQPCRDQAGIVRDVGKEDRIHVVGDAPQPFPVDLSE